MKANQDKFFEMNNNIIKLILTVFQQYGIDVATFQGEELLLLSLDALHESLKETVADRRKLRGN